VVECACWCDTNVDDGNDDGYWDDVENIDVDGCDDEDDIGTVECIWVIDCDCWCDTNDDDGNDDGDDNGKTVDDDDDCWLKIGKNGFELFSTETWRFLLTVDLYEEVVVLLLLLWFFLCEEDEEEAEEAAAAAAEWLDSNDEVGGNIPPPVPALLDDDDDLVVVVVIVGSTSGSSATKVKIWFWPNITCFFGDFKSFPFFKELFNGVSIPIEVVVEVVEVAFVLEVVWRSNSSSGSNNSIVVSVIVVIIV